MEIESPEDMEEHLMLFQRLQVRLERCCEKKTTLQFFLEARINIVRPLITIILLNFKEMSNLQS